MKDAEAVNVRTGKTVRFKDYDDYADFVCSFMEKFAPAQAGGRNQGRRTDAEAWLTPPIQT